LAKGLVGGWIRLFRNARKLSLGVFGPWGGKAAEQYSCIQESTSMRETGLATHHPQHPTLNSSGLHHPTSGMPAAGLWLRHQGETGPSKLQSGRMVREALPSWALAGGRVFPCGQERSGWQEATAGPFPAARTQALLSCAGAEAVMESEAGGTGEETDLPLPSHGAGP